MRKTLILITTLLAPAYGLLAAETAQERLHDAAEVMHEIMATPDKGIPQDLLAKAACVVVVPGMKKGAFIVGAQYGKGFAICRHDHAGWGAPAAIRVEGGSFGFQIGGSETDVVMLIMDERGERSLLDKDKFTIGGDASVAAGPVGRTAAADTDAYMRAEILSWSRARGVFAGIALKGATMRPDMDDNKELYGQRLNSKEVLGSSTPPPEAAGPLIHELDRYSMRKEG